MEQGTYAGAERDAAILLVEDNDLVRELVGELLETAGYRVIAAASGDEALVLAYDVAFDLLLTDVDMPGMTGPELAAALRETRPGLRVVLSSGYTDEPAVVTLAKSGPTAFVAKPYERGVLLETIRTMLGSSV